jgi:hypothetical protein
VSYLSFSLSLLSYLYGSRHYFHLPSLSYPYGSRQYLSLVFIKLSIR